MGFHLAFGKYWQGQKICEIHPKESGNFVLKMTQDDFDSQNKVQVWNLWKNVNYNNIINFIAASDGYNLMGMSVPHS